MTSLQVICDRLTYLVNESLSSGVFQKILKASKQSFLLSPIRIQIKNEYNACTKVHNGTDPEK